MVPHLVEIGQTASEPLIPVTTTTAATTTTMVDVSSHYAQTSYVGSSVKQLTIHSFIHMFLTKTDEMKNKNATMIHDPDE